MFPLQTLTFGLSLIGQMSMKVNNFIPHPYGASIFPGGAGGARWRGGKVEGGANPFAHKYTMNDVWFLKVDDLWFLIANSQ